MIRQRCCAHCPGNPVSSLSRKEHECCLPTYVSGNLKLSSLHENTPGHFERIKRLQRKPSAERKVVAEKEPEDMFSIAKKFHSENLQHQPLPDRVDDRVFMNSLGRNGLRCKCEKRDLERVQKIIPKVPAKILQSPKKKYGPALGCKQPESNMDLAICWEIPVNPVYEPRKPTHVDGSNGGNAPAIFTLIHRNPDVSCGCIDQSTFQDGAEGKECCLCCQAQKNEEDDKKNETQRTPPPEPEPNQDLCKTMDSITISKHVCGKVKPISAQNMNRRSKYSRQLRHCVACDEEKNRHGKDRIQSANYFLQRTNVKTDKRSGLPPKGVLVPRPRTPFARRTFCIDTLTPPFSVVTGSRDADYPEHWRLTSIYQQSYRNPKNKRATILNYH